MTTPTQPDFSATITPHRSLTRKGFRVVMTLLCLTSVVSSLPFVILGAWPVAGFFGLDLLALYIAFRINFSRARSFEQVMVTRLEVLILKVTHRGEAREWRFNPAWTRLIERRHAEFGLQEVAVVSRGLAVPVADALSPPERESFARAFGQALAEARR